MKIKAADLIHLIEAVNQLKVTVGAAVRGEKLDKEEAMKSVQSQAVMEDFIRRCRDIEISIEEGS